MNLRFSTRLFAVTFVLQAALFNSWALAEESITGPLAAKLTATPPALSIGGATAGEISQKIKAGKIEMMKPVTELPPGVEASFDVEFGKGGTKPLLLDLFKPKAIKKPVPGLIFVHGGAWKEGSRKNYGIYCRHFAGKGYVVATIEYRLSGEAPFPAAIQDVNCAIRWMRAQRGQAERRSGQNRPDRRIGRRPPRHAGRLRAKRSRTRGHRRQQRRQLARASGCRYLRPGATGWPPVRAVPNGAPPRGGPVAAIHGWQISGRRSRLVR
jgi:hypothetical protein